MVNANGKTSDPQITVQTRVKTGTNGGELLVFSIRLGWFELVCIAPIPDDGQEKGVAYIKYKIGLPRLDRPTGQQTPSDKNEARDDTDEG
jgi:hypothetical protein